MSRESYSNLPLVTKITQAFAAVGKLQRAGTNKARRYKYTRATDVFAAVRGELFKRGVMLIWDEQQPCYVDYGPSNGGESLTECRLHVKYGFTDGKEETPLRGVNGVGRDVEDKALYKSQTGAQKAMLKRNGLMAEEADDPEFDGQPAETLDDIAPRKVPRKEQPLKDFQQAAIREAMTTTGKTEDQLSQTVTKFGAPSLAEVKQRHFKDLLTWASDGRGTITSPKAPAVPAQPSLPLRTAPAPIEMKIGAQKITFEPKDKPFAL